MKLSTMRYKSFVWPHNPRTYTITFERNMAVNKVPFGRCHLQSLGMTRRVMKGEGEFVGEGAYQKFKELATVFYDETPGTLIHPLWDAAPAWFVGLELEQEPREDYVKYRFEFWEEYHGYRTAIEKLAAPESSGTTNAGTASGGSSSAGAQYHTVVQGETLWSIAQKRGVDLNSLIDLNSKIKNPNLVHIGQKVRVS